MNRWLDKRWLLALALMSACRPAASGGSTAAPEGGQGGIDPETLGPHEGESSQELVERLERLTTQQEAMTARAVADAQVCEDVCLLSTRICEIQEKLCSIADEFPQSDDYQRECRQAKAECRNAQEDCHACADRHQGR